MPGLGWEVVGVEFILFCFLVFLGGLGLRIFDVVVLLLGFEPGPLVRAIASHSVKEGGVVYVFVPHFEDERADRAFADFKRVFDMMFHGKVGLEKVVVDVSSVSNAVAQIKDIFMRISSKDVAICLTGGMRVLAVATIYAYMLTPWRKDPYLEVYLENKGYSIEIPLLHKLVSLEITEEKREVLRALLGGPLGVYDVALEIGKDRSTVYRHLIWLESRGLVRRVGKVFEITDLGKLYA
ncbi:MAG: hypothetical protein DRO23_11550 [Thermoprotei archaeon]|nr:MAG: hypothetical protein DRO23_11550 [Thermoprotei archaeon]